MKAKEFIDKYESYCPQELSMEGDISGLQIGSLDKTIKRLMVTLDVRENTVAEAVEKGVDLIVTKHAPIFRPLKDLTSSPRNDILLELVKHDIAVYVSHTNIDIVPDGLNDWFCDLLGIKDREILTPTSDGYGIGRVGSIGPQSLEDLAQKVKSVTMEPIQLLAEWLSVVAVAKASIRMPLLRGHKSISRVTFIIIPPRIC